MTSSRAVLQVFEKYQKDRVTFVQTVAELATRPQVRTVCRARAEDLSLRTSIPAAAVSPSGHTP